MAPAVEERERVGLHPVRDLSAPGQVLSAQDALGPDRLVVRRPERTPTMRSGRSQTQQVQSLSLRLFLSTTTNRTILSEGCAHSEPELERFLGLKLVVQHTAPLRVIGKNESKRYVQHRHEESNLGSGGSLERAAQSGGDDGRRCAVGQQASGRRVEQQRQRRRHGRAKLVMPRNRLTPTADATGLEGQTQPHGSGNVDVLLDVDEQALVAAEHEAGFEVRRTNRPQVVTAHAVFAAEEELFKDRQIAVARQILDVFELPAETKRHAVVL